MICWANEPWTRNWDGLNRDILLPQTYRLSWATRFARDVAPLLRDQRYFRLDGKPMLLIYRAGHIPAAEAAMRELRIALLEEGIPRVHLAAAWAEFPGDNRMPADPSVLGLDAYFEFPPHMLPSQLLRPVPSGLSQEFVGKIYDYNRTVTATLGQLDDPIEGRRHRGVMAGWDNTARTEARAHVFHGATPTSFRRWLSFIAASQRGTRQSKPSSPAFGPAPQSSNSGLAPEAAFLDAESLKISATQGSISSMARMSMSSATPTGSPRYSNRDNLILPIRYPYSSIYYGRGK
jgi:hypothetical protein